MWITLLASIVLLLASTSVLYAGPAIDRWLVVQQSDGTTFNARKFGDEFQNWTETESGHTVVRNKKTKDWEYANQGPDGALQPSGRKVIPSQKAPADMPKHLKPPRNTKAEKIQSRSMQDIYLQRAPSLSTQLSDDPNVVLSYAVGDWTPLPISGTRKIIVIMVNFTDRSLITASSAWNSAVFSSQISAKSVFNYYKDNSFNTLSIVPVPHSQSVNPAGVVTVSIPYAHPYNGTEESTWVAAAIDAADAYVNFASLDVNGNGYIDRTEALVYLIPAGYEESGTSKTPSVWAHATTYSSGGLLAAGKRFSAYAMNGELSDLNVQHPIGVVAHEMGHQFCGLPDLYDTSDPTQNEGMGYFSLMASGSWGNDTGEDSGTTPTNLDVWSREYLGWATPVTPTSATTLTLAHPLSTISAAYKIIDPLVSTTEYFLVENRQPVGWDSGFIGKARFNSWAGGLLVTHIDITAGTVGSNDINRYTANGGLQGVIPVQARTTACDMLVVGSDCSGDPTTLFYSGNNASWSPLTTPNSNYYNGTPSNFSLLGISPQAAIMTASLSFTPPTPPVIIQLPVAIDNDAWSVTTGGNGNWSGQTTNTHDGIDGAQSPAILDSQSAWMQTAISGPGTLSYWWKVSSEPGFDYLKFYVDGVELTGVAGISGVVDWTQVSGINIPPGSHTIKWEYSKDSEISSGYDTGWLDQVAFTPSVAIQLPVAIDNDTWPVTTGGNGNWSGQTANTHDGIDGAQSPAILDSQSAWMQSVISGPGTLSYWWKVSSESGFDYLKFYVDGVEQAGVAGISGVVDWTQVSGINIPSGSHTIKWEYSKDSDISSGYDAAWLDQVLYTSFYPLTFTFAGTGGGSVNSIIPNSPTINCTSGTICNPVAFPAGIDVTLSALPDQDSIFTGWAATPPCAGTGNCVVTMDAAKYVTGTFTLAPLVTVLERPGIEFSNISAAYDDIGTAAGSTIRARVNTAPFGDLLLNRDIAITLMGGFDTEFSSDNSGYSSMGTLTVAAGSLTLEQIIIK